MLRSFCVRTQIFVTHPSALRPGSDWNPFGISVIDGLSSDLDHISVGEFEYGGRIHGGRRADVEVIARRQADDDAGVLVGLSGW